MKVTIGKYTNWFGPYQLAEKLLFWIPKVKDEHGFYHSHPKVYEFGEWLAHGRGESDPKVGEIHKLFEHMHTTLLHKFLLWIDKHKHRTIKVRIDPWDTYSMDHTLAYIILPMLKQLKRQKQGAPYVDDSDVPIEVQSTSAKPLTKEELDSGSVDEFHFKRWEWVLDEMIFAFDHMVDDSWEDTFISNTPDQTIDFDGRSLILKRMQNGFMLFGKYYQALWT